MCTVPRVITAHEGVPNAILQFLHDAWLLLPNRLSYAVAMVCQPERPACSLRRTAAPLNPTLTERQPHVMKWAIMRRALASLATIVFAYAVPHSARAADTAIQYNRDVRPILFDNCFSCHGPDSASRQAELRLDKREAAVDKIAIVPGNADASEMIRRILSDDADEQMPPPVTKKKLTDAQKKVLVDW